MNPDIRSLIEHTEWYRQATDSYAFFLWTPSVAVTSEFGHPAFYPFVGVHFEGYYVKKTLVKQAQEWIDRAKKDPAVVDRYITEFERIVHKLDLLFAELEKTNIGKLDIDGIKSLLKRFDDSQHEWWMMNWQCDKFDPAGHEMLKQEVLKEGCVFSDEQLHTLTQPAKLNFIDQSELDLYKLAQRCKDYSDAELLEALEPYARKYFYIQNSWLEVRKLGPRDFLKALKDLIKQDMSMRVKQLSSKKELTDDYREAVLKNHPKSLRNVFYLYKTMAEIRDLRKEYVLKSNHYYYQLAKRLAGLLDTEIEVILRAMPSEFQENDLNKVTGRLKKRHMSVLVMLKDRTEILEGKQAMEINALLRKRMLEKHTEVKGICASPGMARGVVKVVMGHAHFSKFKEGDILVAPMTRPEYVPLMKKAAAIITDEGGVTCHAAIISRELKKPCVIGTQIATSVLSDGETVEVDANRGLIKR